MLVSVDDISIENFQDWFQKIIEIKKKAGIRALLENPPDLLERAKLYGTEYQNKSWGWASNIWHRSAPESVVIESEDQLRKEHKILMMRVLEHTLAQGAMLQVDANLGEPNSKGELCCRFICDPQFPDIAYRWTQINFPIRPDQKPEVTLYCIPHYLRNPNIPDSDNMLRVIRFPHHNYSIITGSSYQGEVKKAFLSHWIYHIYQRGGTGEHAALKEFTVKKVDGTEKRVVMAIWGLTGSGKSTHSLYVLNERTAQIFREKFGLNLTDVVYDQVIKNDDILGIFKDQVVCPERGSWTKTEGLNEKQIAMFNAATSSRALHENTEFDQDGNPSFAGELFQYFGRPNRNARTVFYLEDTGYHRGKVDSSRPLNTAIFISPGYTTDYAWVKLNDPAFVAKVLADGRTIGHPAQTDIGIGEVKYVARYCLPFTMGVGNTAHVTRFYNFLKKRVGSKDPLDVYLINTTGRVGTEYDWEERKLGDRNISVGKVRLKDTKGVVKPIGGTGPSIEETELFLFQTVRGAVKYKPHPIWGEKVSVPVEVEGLTKNRLDELDPFTYRSTEEMKKLIRAEIQLSKYYLEIQSPGLPDVILTAMDC